MKYTKAKKNKKFIKLISVVVIIIIASVLLFGISQNNSNNNAKTETPATIIDKTADTSNNQNETAPASTTDTQNITITVSTVGQDTSGEPLLIRTILSSDTEGNCSFKISRNGVEKNYNSNIEFSGKYYSCNYTVPYKDLSSGSWDYQITVSSGKNAGVTYGKVQING